MRPTYPQNLVCSPLDAVTCLLATDRISVMEANAYLLATTLEQFPQSLMHLQALVLLAQYQPTSILHH